MREEGGLATQTLPIKRLEETTTSSVQSQHRYTNASVSRYDCSAVHDDVLFRRRWSSSSSRGVLLRIAATDVLGAIVEIQDLEDFGHLAVVVEVIRSHHRREVNVLDTRRRHLLPFTARARTNAYRWRVLS